MHLKGKVAIITGGAGTLGTCMAVELLNKEAKVCLFDLHKERGHEVEKTLRSEFGKENVTFYLCDITDDKVFTDAFQSAVSHHGNIDIMINNAAFMNEGKDIDTMILVNLGGTIRGSNLTISHMRRDRGGKGGVIINVSSVAGGEPMFAIPAYAGTKHGVNGFTRSWAANPYIKDLGLRFGLLCPFSFSSNLLPSMEEPFLYEKEHTNMKKPQGKQNPKDIAAGLITLLEDDDSNGVMLYSHPKEGTERKKMQVVLA